MILENCFFLGYLDLSNHKFNLTSISRDGNLLFMLLYSVRPDLMIPLILESEH